MSREIEIGDNLMTALLALLFFGFITVTACVCGGKKPEPAKQEQNPTQEGR